MSHRIPTFTPIAVLASPLIRADTRERSPAWVNSSAYCPCPGQQSGDRIVRRFADGEHGARQVERTPGDRHADTYREFIPEFVGDRRLQCIGLQVDALDQMCSDPVVAPVHRRAVRGIKSQADGQIFGGFVVEIGVERRRNLVVRVGLDLRIAPVVVVRQVRWIGFDECDVD